MESLAIGQRCLHCKREYPLYPPLVAGCEACQSEGFIAPIEVVFDYEAVGTGLPDAPQHGLFHYQPLLPPLVDALSLMEGATPLVPLNLSQPKVYIKDESRNPTWSHKDRFNYCAVSSAVTMNKPGVVASSTCNHGASCAAYATRANLPAIILVTPHPPAVSSFLQAYGQAVLGVPTTPHSWALIQQIIETWDYHAVSNYTNPGTNHPFGTEGYKTIAYELYLQLDKHPPDAVFVPVGNGELMFGINKGFQELRQLGIIATIPRMVSCEPAISGSPLKQAVDNDQLIVHTHITTDSEAYAVSNHSNSLRGNVALQESDGIALALTEDEIRHAHTILAKRGIWSEKSSAIAFAGTQKAHELGFSENDVLVSISTSSGFKDRGVGQVTVPESDGSWEALMKYLELQGHPTVARKASYDN